MLFNSLNKIVDYDSKIDIKNENVTNEITSENINKNPIIYIYNTHDTEKYTIPYISDYSITPDVRLSSFILKDHLNDLKIESYVETNRASNYLKKNNLNYYYSYEASRYYLKKANEKYNFKYFIDIHRDSVKYDKTIYIKNNKKYARILFVLTMNHKKYKENEKFVNNLNNKLNSKYKGLSRGILKRKDCIFNQDISPYSILLEVGGVDNTIDEINNTLYIFAKILKEYIDEDNKNE